MPAMESRVAFSDNEGKVAAHQLKELFLPFRCFSTRKDIQVNEVVIEDTDIRFLYHVLYTGGNNIPGICTDIPGSVTKGAPHFCNVRHLSLSHTHTHTLTYTMCRKFERELAGEVESLRPILSSSSREEPYLTHLAQWLIKGPNFCGNRNWA